jgi:DNA-binding response OmpR family regulator
VGGRVALRKRILIVESGIPVVPFEQSLLLRKDHDIYRAATGEEALEIIRAGSFDLIISDERLSDMDAIAVTLRMREFPNGKNISVLILGSPPPDGPPVGVNRFLSKPVMGQEFEDTCRALLSIESRKEVRLLVYVQVQGYLQSNLFLCNSVNMSASGILLLTARKLRKGDTIQLQITLPREREKVKVTGEVIREAKEVGSRLNAYGIRFSDVNEEDQARIRQFIIETHSSTSP